MNHNLVGLRHDIWYNDIQHNDTQHNDSQHKKIKYNFNPSLTLKGKAGTLIKWSPRLALKCETSEQMTNRVNLTDLLELL